VVHGWYLGCDGGLLEAHTGDRPFIKGVLQCLDRASETWTPPSARRITIPLTTNPPAQNSGPSTEGSTSESETSPSSGIVSPQPSQELPLTGEPIAICTRHFAHAFSAPPYAAPGYRDLEASVINPDGSDSEDSADRVSWAAVLGGFWF